MPKFIDRTGQRFGRLLVLEEAGRSQLKKVLWKCRCDCNNVVLRTAGDLVTGNSVSCGCYLKERITKHGGWKNASYNTWRAMMRRCYKPHDKDYPRYGGAGVTVCVRWHEYVKFAEDMGEPVGAETLDRINPYGNYEPNNCRWASLPTQARNIRVRKDSKSGYIGVHKRGNKWLAEITANRKKYYASVCDTLEEAVSAREALELRYWGTP